MLRRKAIYLLAMPVLVVGISVALVAKTAHAENTVKSDYANDVQNGQDQIKSDPLAAANQQEVNNNEGEQGEIENENVDTGEQVDPAEAKDSVNNESSGSSTNNSTPNSTSNNQTNSGISSNGQ
jgi:hypothetical protein